MVDESDNKRYDGVSEKDVKINKNIEEVLRNVIKEPRILEKDTSNNSELMAIEQNFILKVAYNELSPEQASEELIRQFNEKLQEIKENKK